MHPCIFPQWIQTDRHEDSVTDYPANASFIHCAQLSAFLKWASEKILALPQDDQCRRRYEMNREGNESLGSFHLDMVVFNGAPTPSTPESPGVEDSGIVFVFLRYESDTRKP
jgi:hypothetical protein